MMRMVQATCWLFVFALQLTSASQVIGEESAARRDVPAVEESSVSPADDPANHVPVWPPTELGRPEVVQRPPTPFTDGPFANQLVPYEFESGFGNFGIVGRRNTFGLLWGQVNFLGWWLRGYSVPSLVTTSADGTPANNVGLLGNTNTRVLFGGERLGDEMRGGYRLKLGRWFSACRQAGFEVEAIGFDDVEDRFVDRSEGDFTLARPFVNTDTGMPDAQIVALDGLASGELDFHSTSRAYSLAPTLRWNGLYEEDRRQTCHCFRRFDFLIGYRYWRLDDELRAFERLLPQNSSQPSGTFFELTDLIDVQNHFHGAELGGQWQRQAKRWTMSVTAKVAVGNVQQRYQLRGTSRAVIPGIFDETISGGFLVPAERVGSNESNQFSILPQADITMGYFVTPHIQLHGGYTFNLVANMLRPNSFIDLNLDGSQIATRPDGLPTHYFVTDDTTVVVHGFSVGATLSY